MWFKKGRQFLREATHEGSSDYPLFFVSSSSLAVSVTVSVNTIRQGAEGSRLLVFFLNINTSEQYQVCSLSLCDLGFDHKLSTNLKDHTSL